MILKEQLKLLPPTVTVYIGGQGSGGWHYIGDKFRCEYKDVEVIKVYPLLQRNHVGIILNRRFNGFYNFWDLSEYNKAHGLPEPEPRKVVGRLSECYQDLVNAIYKSAADDAYVDIFNGQTHSANINFILSGVYEVGSEVGTHIIEHLRIESEICHKFLGDFIKSDTEEIILPKKYKQSFMVKSARCLNLKTRQIQNRETLIYKK